MVAAPRRLTLNELNAAYPGTVDSLMRHEGIGIVMAYAENGEPMVFGKKGARNLTTGDVTQQMLTTGFEVIQTNLTGTSGDDLLILQGGSQYHGGLGNDSFYADWCELG